MRPRLEDIIVGLADEGVPLRCIARQTRVAFEDVWRMVSEAMNDGRMVELPANDWPTHGQGARRAERLRTFRPNGVSPRALIEPLMRAFALTQTEALVVALLTLRGTVTRQAMYDAITPAGASVDTDPKILDVIFHKVRRKLAAHQVEITTLHGYGHSLQGASMERVRQRVFGPEPAPEQDNVSHPATREA